MCISLAIIKNSFRIRKQRKHCVLGEHPTLGIGEGPPNIGAPQYQHGETSIPIPTMAASTSNPLYDVSDGDAVGDATVQGSQMVPVRPWRHCGAIARGGVQKICTFGTLWIQVLDFWTSKHLDFDGALAIWIFWTWTWTGDLDFWTSLDLDFRFSYKGIAY